jgi:autotransporter-associated beta strand protein
MDMSGSKNVRLFIVRVGFTFVLLAVGSAACGYTTAPIAIQGQDTGYEENGNFGSLWSPIDLNAAGQAAFYAQTTVPYGEGNGGGIFRSDGTSLTRIAYLGQDSGFEENGSLSYLSDPVINTTGQSAFLAYTTGTSGQGVFRGDGSSLTRIAYQGQDSGSWFNQNLSYLYAPVINASGQAAFYSVTTGTSTAGIFRGDGSSLACIAFRGQYTGYTETGNLDYLSSQPVINASSQVAFYSSTTGTSTSGIFRGDGGSLTRIAYNAQNTGYTENGNLNYISDPVINASGQIAFWASTTGTSTAGIFRGDGSSLTRMAYSGQNTGYAENGNISSPFVPQFNDAGQVAFGATTTGTSNYGIFRSDGSSLTRVARQGQLAPDGDGTFNFDLGEGIHLNCSSVTQGGAVLFQAIVDNSVYNWGVFLSDGQEIIQVARRGQSLAGSTITDIGGTSPITDSGQVAYQATLADDRTGYFLFTVDQLHYRSATSGNWDTLPNWTLSLKPGACSNVTISPASTLTVNGPQGATTVKSLTIGGSGGGAPTLALNGGGQLYVNSDLVVQSNAVLQVSKGAVTVGGSLLNSGGAILAEHVTVSSAMLNQGQMTIQSGGMLQTTAGTLTNLAYLTLSGGAIDAGAGQLINDYGASMEAKGTITGNFDNNGELTASGVLTVNGQLNNQGIINLGSGTRLDGTGLPIDNLDGTIRGQGAVTKQLSNTGGLIHADAGGLLALSKFSSNGEGGEMRVEGGSTLRVLSSTTGLPIPNQGSVILTGSTAALTGDAIDNSGTVLGQGRITNTLTNNGVIRAEGGQLTLAGSGLVNPGRIEVPAGATLFVTQGLANSAGQLALAGGAFDNNNHPLTNHGSIAGHGTLRSGGLTNQGNVSNLATVHLADGATDIFGPVTNGSFGTMIMEGSASTIATFYGPVTNESGGQIQILGGTVRFLGGVTGFTNSGAASLARGSAAIIQNGAGDLLQTGGSLNVGDAASLTAKTVKIHGGTLSADGPNALITAGLEYTSPASSTYAGIVAGAGKTLTLDNPAATLTLTGHNTYTGLTTITNGTLALASSGQIDSSSAIVNNATFLVADGVTAHNVSAITGTGTTQLDASANLTATSVMQGTVTLGPGATLTIAALPSGPMSGTSVRLLSVPEPSSLLMLLPAIWVLRRRLLRSKTA